MKLVSAFTAILLALPVFASDGIVVGNQGLQNEATPVLVPPPPAILSVTPISAVIQPAQVTLTGHGFEFVNEVFVGGFPAVIVHQDPSQMTIIPRAVIPGFHEVVVKGVTGAAQARMEAWPSLEASVLRSILTVRLCNGDDGRYMLAANLEKRQNPYFMNVPSVGYMMLLEDDMFFLSAGWVPSGAPMTFKFSIPPGLQGFPLHLQAWCDQRESPTATKSCFSNMASTRM